MLQGMFFLFTEPVAGACKQFLFQLGIDLCMFYSGAVDIMFRFNTDESAAACRVAEQVGAVAGSDERGNTGEWPEIFLIGFADVEAGICIRFFSNGIFCAPYLSNSSILSNPISARRRSGLPCAVSFRLQNK